MMIRSTASTPNPNLKLLHGSDIAGLDIVLEPSDLVLEIFEGDLLILYNQVDLELLDTEADSDKLGTTPNQTILLDTTNSSLEGLHVGLVICIAIRQHKHKHLATPRHWEGYRKSRTPRLDIHSDNRLSGELRLGILLLLVLSQTLIADAGSLSILLLVVAAEKVDILIILLLGGGGLGGVEGHLGDIGSVDGVGLAGIAGQGGKLVLVRGDLLVPARGIGVLGGVGARLQGLEDGDISLGCGETARAR